MNGLFFYAAMWGTLRGNIEYELACGGRDLLPMQSALQHRCANLYAQSRDLVDGAGGRKINLDDELLEVVWTAPKQPPAAISEK